MSQRPVIRQPGSVSRKPVTQSTADIVRTRYLAGDRAIPFVIEPVIDEVNLTAWALGNRQSIERLLLTHRALLFRGFDVTKGSDLRSFAEATCKGGLQNYSDRSSPRYEVGDGVYLSTTYPSEGRINLHNEGSYWLAWVLKIYFCCLVAAERGGETPIADVRKVFDRLKTTTRDRFMEKQVMYVRNYNDGFGLPWEEAFQTDSRAAAEAYCLENKIDFYWKDQNRLQTRQVRPAIRRHPRTGEWLWFNHAAFFHIFGQENDLRDGLSRGFVEHELPFMTYYGDGTSIEPWTIEEVKEAYNQEKVMFTWQPGDILLLDNMTVAHGREPYEGARQVLVAMAELYSDSD
jgi:alpha-ketoglutarate-dependent taurine dioxygenase